MNPIESTDINARLSVLLDYIGATVKDADSLVREQAPLVAQEIVAWHIASSVVCGVAFLAATILTAWWMRAIWRAVGDDGKLARESDPFFTALLVVFVICTTTTIANLYHITKAVVSPRLVVLDYVRGLK